MGYNQVMDTSSVQSTPKRKGLNGKQVTQLALLIAGTLALLAVVIAGGVTGVSAFNATGQGFWAVALTVGASCLGLMLLTLVAYFISGAIFFHRTLKGTTFLSRKIEVKS